ncbi:MAG: hypothetical protein ACLR6L_10955, partial [Agathobaculum sp.]
VNRIKVKKYAFPKQNSLHKPAKNVIILMDSFSIIPAGFLPCRPRLLCMQMHTGTQFVLCGL